MVAHARCDAGLPLRTARRAFAEHNSAAREERIEGTRSERPELVRGALCRRRPVEGSAPGGALCGATCWWTRGCGLRRTVPFAADLLYLAALAGRKISRAASVRSGLAAAGLLVAASLAFAQAPPK